MAMMNLLQKHAASSVVAKLVSSTALVAAALLLILSGCAKPSEQDKQQMALLEQRFGDRYVFKFEGEFYVAALLKTGHDHSDHEAQEIVKTFEFVDFERKVRRDTTYIYFNFHDADGRFLYQLFHDPQKDRFEQSSTPHY